jgi:hypothetical protein
MADTNPAMGILPVCADLVCTDYVPSISLGYPVTAFREDPGWQPDLPALQMLGLCLVFSERHPP